MAYLNRHRMLKINPELYFAVSQIAQVYDWFQPYANKRVVSIVLVGGQQRTIEDGRTLEQVLQEINDAV